jgi:hypothetical protein
MTWPPLWGHYYWLLIHCATVRCLPRGFGDPHTAYKSATTTTLPPVLIPTLRTLLDNLPCRVCVKHAQAYVKNHPIPTNSAKDLTKYFFDLHNDVNKRLGKVEISIGAMFEQLNYQLVHHGCTVNDIYKGSSNSFKFCFFIPLTYSACIIPNKNTWFVEFIQNYHVLLPFSSQLVDTAMEAIDIVTVTYNKHCGDFGHSPLNSAELLKRFRHHFSDAEFVSTSRAYTMRLEDHRTISSYVDSFQRIPRLSTSFEPIMISLLVSTIIFIIIAVAFLVSVRTTPKQPVGPQTQPVDSRGNDPNSS